MVRRIQGIANAELTVGRHQTAGHFIVNGFMNDQPACGGAALTRGPYRPKDRTDGGQFEIGIRSNNDGIVTTQF